MADGLCTYVLALRRGLSESAPADWQTRVRELPGVCAGPAASPNRIQIEADAEALSRIRAELGGFLHIERLAMRDFLDG